ncbi:hypothetical protein [uncultured Rothia sp.]
MAKKNLPPYTDQEIRELIHQIIRRLIVAGLTVIAAGVLIIVALKIWGG